MKKTKVKIKTRKALEKRVHRTGSGIFLIREMLSQHRVSGKSKRRRRAAGKMKPVHTNEVKKIKKMLPYL